MSSEPKPTTNALADACELQVEAVGLDMTQAEVRETRRHLRAAAAALRMPTIPADDAALVKRLRDEHIGEGNDPPRTVKGLRFACHKQTVSCREAAGIGHNAFGWAADKLEAQQVTMRLAARRIEALAAEKREIDERIAAVRKVCDQFDEGDRLDPDGNAHNLRRAVLAALTTSAKAKTAQS